METAIAFILLCSAIRCTFLTRFVQFRRPFPRHTPSGNVPNNSKAGGVSSFQATATSLAASIGTGNIVGIAGAILLGGSGVVFWLWISALFGMAGKYVDIYLGMEHRDPGLPGALGYMSRIPFPWFRPLALVYCVCCLAACLCMGNLVQVNAISQACIALKNTFFPSVPNGWVFLSVGLLSLAAVRTVQSGGAVRVGKLTGFLVPVMSIFYLVCAATVIAVNAEVLPSALKSIVQEAWTPRAFLIGIARGTFSHEAGLGTACLAHNNTLATNAHREAQCGIFEVFADAFLCTLTALAILTSGFFGIVPGSIPSSRGGGLVTEVFSGILGPVGGSVSVAAATGLFALSSIFSFSYYGEQCFLYLSKQKYQQVYRLFFLALLLVGASASMDLVWDLAQWANLMIGLINTLAVLLLTTPWRIKKPST